MHHFVKYTEGLPPGLFSVNTTARISNFFKYIKST